MSSSSEPICECTEPNLDRHYCGSPCPGLCEQCRGSHNSCSGSQCGEFIHQQTEMVGRLVKGKQTTDYCRNSVKTLSWPLTTKNNEGEQFTVNLSVPKNLLHNRRNGSTSLVQADAVCFQQSLDFFVFGRKNLAPNYFLDWYMFLKRCAKNRCQGSRIWRKFRLFDSENCSWQNWVCRSELWNNPPKKYLSCPIFIQ